MVEGREPEEPPVGTQIAEIDAETSKISLANIQAYGEPVGPLRDSSWQTSIYRWMGDHWDVLIDLTTPQGEVTDLVLRAKVRPTSSGFLIEPGLVYVP
ncbi:DUF7668 domain-containing protein [Henriciella pelagia]|jgi:hypothetical protein|uniref:DUF7668 domain-containing protein n=1 Tax=Henriciella pelagia TaxID=1977912 RepID=A0ABQ1JIY6_9PROT|nr:hypothetical protein [Henriciella pelagia]GGB67174.1 hypothetical protein GCM10011503_14950 [Henriciella pelagia]